MASCHAGVRGLRAPDDGDLSRPAQVFVPEADFDRAHQIFYAEREDELWPRPFSARFRLQVILAR
jgi:hypothetical protein